MESSDQDRVGSSDCEPNVGGSKSPSDVNVISSKYVFKVERYHTGSIEHFKVRLVARGFSQVHGVDYEETYSSVVRIGSVFFVFAVASICGLLIVLADVPNAYVKGQSRKRYNSHLRNSNYHKTRCYFC